MSKGMTFARNTPVDDKGPFVGMEMFEGRVRGEKCYHHAGDGEGQEEGDQKTGAEGSD